MNNYLKLDYGHIPVRATVHQHGILIKKWSAKKPTDLIHTVIDNMNCSGFEKIKIKNTIKRVLDVFEPKTITIISKDEK